MERIEILELDRPFQLQSGYRIDRPKIAYSTLNAQDSKLPWALVYHGLSASSDITSWWQKFPWETFSKKYRTICFNSLGSCHGTTEVPLNENSDTLAVTIADTNNLITLALQQMKIGHIKIVLGCSLGGQQAIDLYLRYPALAEKYIAVCGGAIPKAQALYNQAYLGLLKIGLEQDSENVISRSLAYSRYFFRLSCTNDRGIKALAEKLGADNASSTKKLSEFYLQDALSYPKKFSALSFHHLMNAVNHFSVEFDANYKKTEPTHLLHLIGISDDLFTPADEIKKLYTRFGQLGHPVSYDEFNTNYGHEAWILDGERFYEKIKNYFA